MKNRDFKNIAKEVLRERWGRAALITLVYTISMGIISFALMFVPVLGPIISFILNPVLSFGFLKQWLLFKEYREVGVFDFLKLGFEDFVMVWCVMLRVFLKKIGPVILMILGSIGMFIGAVALVGEFIQFFFEFNLNIATVRLIYSLSFLSIMIALIWSIPLNYKYMFAFNELAYDSNRSAREIVEISGNYMNGKKWGAFVLNISFIGWALLTILGLGIPTFWITPYMQLAMIAYYEYASSNSHSKGNVFDELPERADITYDD